MRRINPRAIAIVLSSGASLGSVCALRLWLLGRANPLALVAASVLVLVASVVLHDTGVRYRTIIVTIGAVAMLAGVGVLVLWLSLRNWEPTW